MSEKPEALKIADAMLLQINENMALRRENERLRQRYHMEQEIFRGGMYHLRSLLLRIREWDHLDSAADGAFWKREIDKALQEDKT